MPATLVPSGPAPAKYAQQIKIFKESVDRTYGQNIKIYFYPNGDMTVEHYDGIYKNEIREEFEKAGLGKFFSRKTHIYISKGNGIVESTFFIREIKK